MARGVALAPDVPAKIVLAGFAPQTIAIARLEDDGDLDPTWAGDARQTVDVFNFDRSYAAGLMADGRVSQALAGVGPVTVPGPPSWVRGGKPTVCCMLGSAACSSDFTPTTTRLL